MHLQPELQLPAPKLPTESHSSQPAKSTEACCPCSHHSNTANSPWLASKTRLATVSITMSRCGCDACYDCDHGDDYCYFATPTPATATTTTATTATTTATLHRPRPLRLRPLRLTTATTTTDTKTTTTATTTQMTKRWPTHISQQIRTERNCCRHK